ncbi:hypothetical protein TREMEDRAFT_65579 [Tremella mesenterica DSM 1558]|uniref:uncharacterized protein n=1 Tax=Tremella mesenterica (strain ATCC 24925 / CBS 8224 / DSM 1558 / NBRC 9311 / NRRL Y-6157 / RJB 2259-6 / UBC 559-6) TaxID=578456 RepID=UPI00032C8AB8|nr:uncharacterized protein TREMEDRAFT_65579 [Tremella mesenterica DSM 1558]EIW66308.1 hypothetical protein TREMEDRAFT_65579 [Tremella mesenterica DSM 1558]
MSDYTNRPGVNPSRVRIPQGSGSTYFQHSEQGYERPTTISQDPEVENRIRTLKEVTNGLIQDAERLRVSGHNFALRESLGESKTVDERDTEWKYARFQVTILGLNPPQSRIFVLARERGEMTEWSRAVQSTMETYFQDKDTSRVGDDLQLDRAAWRAALTLGLNYEDFGVIRAEDHVAWWWSDDPNSQCFAVIEA